MLFRVSPRDRAGCPGAARFTRNELLTIPNQRLFRLRDLLDLFIQLQIC